MQRSRSTSGRVSSPRQSRCRGRLRPKQLEVSKSTGGELKPVYFAIEGGEPVASALALRLVHVLTDPTARLPPRLSVVRYSAGSFRCSENDLITSRTPRV